MGTMSTKTLSSVLAVLAIANILVSVYLWTVEWENRPYTYTLDDYPEHLPLSNPKPPVALVMEESEHYGISHPDAREEWATTTATGFGYVRLGPDRRAFALSMFHQLHCLRLLRAGLDGDYRPQIQGHFRHCLNYLRQMILCQPDLTLEPHNVIDHDPMMKGPTSVHVCSDWREVYDAVEDNYAAWVQERPALANQTNKRGLQ
ncbi:unnamed protein product [Peniophora sp. CBMAI 1063]|nr:unnamed protein product [Peniophora sp. CBMAI 1063]